MRSILASFFVLLLCTTFFLGAADQWKIKTGGTQIPAGWEPFAYDCKDAFDPFLLRRCTTGNWDNQQKWEVKTSNVKIPVGWEPFAYDSKDQFDPFLLRQRIK